MLLDILNRFNYGIIQSSLPLNIQDTKTLAQGPFCIFSLICCIFIYTLRSDFSDIFEIFMYLSIFCSLELIESFLKDYFCISWYLWYFSVDFLFIRISLIFLQKCRIFFVFFRIPNISNIYFIYLFYFL